MANKRDAKPAFRGFRSPKYTQVPDELFDELLPELSGAELKVLLYIIRRTFGFKRDSDSISLSQMLNGIQTRDGQVLDRGAGVSKPTLLQALRSLEERGIIQTERRRSADKGDEPTVYMLRFAGDGEGGQEIRPPLVKEFDHGGGQQTSPPGWSRNLTTQETVRQETVNTSKPRKAHAKKSGGTDGEWESPATPSTPSVSGQSVSHPKAEPSDTEATRSPAARAAVVPAASPEIPDQYVGVPAAQTRGLRDSTAPAGGTAAPSGDGYQRLRETVQQIRAGMPRDDRDSGHDAPAQPAETSASGMTPLAAVLPAAYGRSVGSREDRDRVAAYLRDFQHELGDEAPLSSSITRALNIFARAQIPPERWADCLYQARSITKERSAQITKKRSDTATGFAAKNRAPFYFAVLEDLCGLREQPGSTVPGTA